MVSNAGMGRRVALLLAGLSFCWVCVFDPDFTGYYPCDDLGRCLIPGCVCLAGKICVPMDERSGTQRCVPCASHVECDDANVCTDDVCESIGTCRHDSSSGSCDDGDLCTHADSCSGGECVGTPYSCDDGNPCTDDYCAGDGSCRRVERASSCDDGDPCTVNERCEEGVCRSTGPDKDADRDGYVDSTCGGADCDDQPSSCGADCHPGLVEICDGFDNDCDPSTVDGSGEMTLSEPCDGPDGDLCQDGKMACGGRLFCDEPAADKRDVCDGVDNDCDPESKDGGEDPLLGIPCDGPDTDHCEDDVYVDCSDGSLICSTGADAVEGPTGAPACSDLLDNDCDGLTDGDDGDCRPIMSNVVLSSAGAVIESFSSEYCGPGNPPANCRTGYWDHTNVNDGEHAHGYSADAFRASWASSFKAGSTDAEEFVFAFAGNRSAWIKLIVVQNYGEEGGAGPYYATHFVLYGQPPASNSWYVILDQDIPPNEVPVAFDLLSINGSMALVQRLKLSITRSVALDYWEIGEFEAWGFLIL